MIRLRFLAALFVMVSGSAFAQEMDEAPPPDDDVMAEHNEMVEEDPIDTSDVAISDAQADAEDAAPVEEVRSGTDPFEEPSETYMFLGLGYRHTWTPGFILGLFTDEYEKTNNPGFGLEFTYRKDNFDIITSAYYQRFAVHGAFRGLDDADTETEIIDSDLAAIFVGVDLLWGTDFTPWFSLQYGLGLGLGVVFGDMSRNEAYPDANGEFNGYSQCDGPGDPNGGGYCDAPPAGHYGFFDKWAQGGSVPNIYLRAAPHIALRFKPIHQVVIRVDGGFDVFSGFFFGGALAYGF